MGNYVHGTESTHWRGGGRPRIDKMPPRRVDINRFMWWTGHMYHYHTGKPSPIPEPSTELWISRDLTLMERIRTGKREKGCYNYDDFIEYGPLDKLVRWVRRRRADRWEDTGSRVRTRTSRPTPTSTPRTPSRVLSVPCK